jgi:ankyrin repeat protein
MQAERISTGPGTIEAYINGAEFDSMFNRRDNPGRLIPKGWQYQDLIFFDSTLKEYVSLIREAKNSGRIQQSTVDMLFMKAKVEATRDWHVFSRTLLWGYEYFLAKAGTLMNLFATARLGVAIERHRLAKGSLPDNLDELVSTYIDAIPFDISTGNPIAWERKGKHRYRIPAVDVRRNTWKYDPILAAIQLGDLDRLEKMSDEGWELTTPKPGEESRHEAVRRRQYPDPNYLGVPESVALASQGALKLAGLSGNMEMLQWLLDRGLTPGDDDLELAVEMQQVDVVKMLLDAGIQLPLERRLNSTFKSVFEKANLEILPLLLAKVPEPLLPKALEEDRPVSLLRKTLAKGDLAKARLLIEKGADVNHPRPNESVMTGRMQFSYDQGGSETNSVIAIAARIADWDFFQLVLDKGASLERRELDGSTPLRHAAANRDSSILKYFLDKQPNQTKEDLHEAIQTAASSGRLEQVKLLEQAGANLDDIDIINASFRSQNLDLIEYLIQKAKKPLSKNEAWRFALGALDYVIWSEGNLNPNLTNLDFAKIRNIATVMIENGLQSTNIQNAGDVANLTKEKLEALEKREEEEEEIGVDSDGDGVDDWTEETLVGGYDPNDPDNFPTPEEIWAAKAADAATADQ